MPEHDRKPDPCSNCGGEMPSILEDGDYPYPNYDPNVWLCGPCNTHACDQCDDGTIMVQTRPGWKWHCPQCGETTSPEMMEFFEGKRAVRFIGESDDA